MERGVHKYWTPEDEEHYRRLIDSCQTFAVRHLIMTLRDLLKYDGRTKQAKRAIAEGRLRLASATDEDLEQMAELECKMGARGIVRSRLRMATASGGELEGPAKLESKMQGEDTPDSVAYILKDYKILRAKIRQRGIKKSELES